MKSFECLNKKVNILFDPGSSMLNQAGKDNLNKLADERALAIKQYLVDEVKFTHERISVIKTSSNDLSATIISMGIGAI